MVQLSLISLWESESDSQESEKPKPKKKRKPTTKYKHIKPTSILYKGGYDNVTICEDCGRTAHDFDQSVHDPCPDCGGTIKYSPNGGYSWNNKDKYIAKWCVFENEYQWLHRLDSENMTKEEYQKESRRRKFHRIFKGK